ncbi:hypothetical protein GOODEAATRI_001989 [Goodea atripinnis]|uniref:Uncharacterized protein n=1 Tax=Goodea atripinnis TaxID=208336 RepID=A0ABV0MXY7_9TELE
MLRETLALLFLGACLDSAAAARTCSSFFCRKSHRVSGLNGVDPGSPLFITPYLEKGAIDEGQDKAPVLLWLQGGPGGTSMFGLFVEHGPYVVYKNMTGKNWSGRDEQQTLLEQASASLMMTEALPRIKMMLAETCTGKYVPAISYYIHKNNPTAKVKINFKGMAIGDGLCDPELVFDSLLNGDVDPYPSFFQNATGCTNYFNYMTCQEPEDQEYFSQFVTMPAVRKAIHVGNLTFHDGSEVEKHLLQDVMKSIKPWLGVLMDNYRVLIYSGQLDVIVAAPLTERFLPTVNWTGAAEYKTAPRFHWKLQPSDTEVAGYVRQVGEFFQVSGCAGQLPQRRMFR